MAEDVEKIGNEREERNVEPAIATARKIESINLAESLRDYTIPKLHVLETHGMKETSEKNTCILEK